MAHWFQHTSRDGDMQLHVHSQIAHVARTADGKWRAPDSYGYNEHVGAVAAIVSQHLEEALTARFGVAWAPRDDGHGMEIAGISGQMMRVFSSRARPITADLRARAREFEARYGRAPSQREVAQLAQASNFATRARKDAHALDFAQLHAGWADRLARRSACRSRGRAVGVGRARHSSRGRARPWSSGARSDRAGGAGGAAGVGPGPAGQEHVHPRRPDQVLGPGAAPDGHGPGYGGGAAGGPGRPGAGVGSSGRWSAWKHPTRWPRHRSLRRADGRSVYQRHGGVRYATRVQLSIEERMVAQARAQGAPALSRDLAARALGASVTQLDAALTPCAQDTHAHAGVTRSGLRRRSAGTA